MKYRRRMVFIAAPLRQSAAFEFDDVPGYDCETFIILLFQACNQNCVCCANYSFGASVKGT
jgi:hypothetical protein